MSTENLQSGQPSIAETAAVQLKGTVDKPDFDLLGTLLRTSGKGLSHGVGSLVDRADNLVRWISRPRTNQTDKKQGSD